MSRFKLVDDLRMFDNRLHVVGNGGNRLAENLDLLFPLLVTATLGAEVESIVDRHSDSTLVASVATVSLSHEIVQSATV